MDGKEKKKKRKERGKNGGVFHPAISAVTILGPLLFCKASLRVFNLTAGNQSL